MYRLALLFAISLLVACSDPPSISVDCSLSQQDEYSFDCGTGSNNNNVIGSPGSAVGAPSDRDAGAGLPKMCPPLPMVGAWIRDIDGSSSFGSFVLHPTGENWRFALDLPAGTIDRIEVPVRPFATPPTKPASGAAIAVLTGSYLNDNWSVIGEVVDDVNGLAYGAARTVALSGLAVVKADKDGAAYGLTLKAPLDNVETSALVVTGPPYVTMVCD